MIPATTCAALTAFALAAKVVLQDTDTPKMIRDKLVRFAAELRDSLEEGIARMVDAQEVEAVILAYALSLPPSPQIAENTLQSPRTSDRTLPALEGILDDISQ